MFLMIISLCGLIYQFQIIYNQYISCKSIVSLEIGRFFDETLSAITLCFYGLFSLERAVKFHPGFAGIKETYQQLLRNFSSLKFWKLHHDTFGNYIDENHTKRRDNRLLDTNSSSIS